MCVCLVTRSCLTLCDSLDCSLPDSSVYVDSPNKNTGVGCHALLHLPKPGIEPRSPALQAVSLPVEPPGKPIYICIYMFESILLISSN